MKLLLDMNLSPTWISFLNNAGFAATHWSAVGASIAADSEIMTYAIANNFVVITHDLDFSAILAATHVSKPSVVQIRAQDISPKVIGNHVITALQQMKSDPNRTRVRVLPLSQPE